jgi:hypothetical protein
MQRFTRTAASTSSAEEVSLVDVGAANISASGHVYNLKNLADFNGNYVAITAGMTVAGASAVTGRGENQLGTLTGGLAKPTRRLQRRSA